MKAKTKEIAEEIVKEDASSSALYDREAVQTIPLEITKGNHTFRVAHVLASLSDARFIEYEQIAKTNAKRIVKQEKLSVEFYAAKETLWNDLATERIGYKPTPDWKAKTHLLDKVNAVDALLHAQVLSEPEEVLEADTLFDDDELTEISLRVMQSGTLLETKHFFREETKAELDSFLAIVSGANDPNAIASAVKLTDSERASALYAKVCEHSEGYANNDCPIWHKAAAVNAFFSGQLSRLGKS